MHGIFISVEGIEGAGKSTHCRSVADWLIASGREVVCTREPGGTDLAERLRALLLDPRLPRMSPITELLLLFASRCEHVQTVIRPAIEGGKWVVCDRFTDATYAYQGAGRGVDIATIAALETIALGNLRPDLTILLDTPVRCALERVRARGASDRFEQEDGDFFARVRDCYLRIAAAEPRRVFVIDTNRPVDLVRDQIYRLLKARCA